MSTRDSNKVTFGIGIDGLLTLVFTILKLTHQIAWSWTWVLSPLWISFLLILLIFVLKCVAKELESYE